MNKRELDIADELESMIRSGKLLPGDKIPSEYELAEEYGINRKTANKAVAKLEERRLILRTKGRGGSRVAPRLPVRGIIGYRLKLISAGILCARLLQGAQRAAASRDYALQYYEFEHPEMAHWEKIGYSGIAGVLYTSSTPPPENFPLPTINVLHDFGPDFVIPDDYSGGRQAAELFLRCGHTNIAVISDAHTLTRNSRLDGFMETLRNTGIPHPEKRLITIPSGKINQRALWEDILKITPPVTGIFCFSDAIAIRMILLLESIGLRVPEDFSVCGFGNMKMINNIRQMTTVEQFPENLAYNACIKLIDKIENKSSETVQISSPVELINPRATVGQMQKQMSALSESE